jgi:hypothetical protein
MGVPPESTVVEIDLTEHLVHHGLPPETVADHQHGWAHFLGVLRDRLSPE